MRFSVRCLPVFSIGLLLMGCQGDARPPAAPDRMVDGAVAPIQCPWDSTITDVYQNRYKSDKRAACKTIAQQEGANELDEAELGINQLLLALYNDYAVCVGAPFGAQDLDACPFADGASVDPADVVTFALATCDLVPALPQTGDVDCVVPYEENLDTNPALPTDPTAGIQAGWVVATLTEGASLVLPNGEFGIEIDDLESGITEVFVSMRENPPTPILGACPVKSDNDCTQNNYLIDTDGEGEPYNDNDPIADSPEPGLYLEICEDPAAPFAAAAVPARCVSSSNTCEPAQSIPDRDLLACSKGALAFSPSTWTAADGALAVRDVVCKVAAQSAAVSEGTTCTVLDRLAGTPVPGKSCLTIPDPETGPKAAKCTIPDILAANQDDAHDGSPVLYTMEATKIDSGVSHFGSTEFELRQDNPLYGEVKDVFVDVLPPGQQ